MVVISTQALLVIDHRTMSLKNRIPMEYLEKISLSPYQDSLAVFHIKKVSSVLMNLVAFALHCAKG